MSSKMFFFYVIHSHKLLCGLWQKSPLPTAALPVPIVQKVQVGLLTSRHNQRVLLCEPISTIQNAVPSESGVQLCVPVSTV